ncbi:MAG: CCA tRNA nucleotidyltransferase [Phycisphaerae bacterium]
MEIVRALRAAGGEALLAGGCVRDLLLGLEPHDYDVATNLPPEQVARQFRGTRQVGAAFGVVLVRKHGVWVEVATFRTDGAYRDGRRPESVVFTDAEHDARRRDFTINGMFLDPLAGRVIDYVGGRADLAARVVRAIGDPAVRFAEDHLRLLRAVRFTARFDFALEAATSAALRAAAANLARVAAERTRDELEKILAHAGRARAVRLAAKHGLWNHIRPPFAWRDEQLARAADALERVGATASFELAFAVLVADRGAREIDDLCRDLTFSNEQRERVLWLVGRQDALDVPERISRAALKRLLAHPGAGELRAWAAARFSERADGAARLAELERRIAAIPADAIAPPPLVTGDDLIARGLTPGPRFKELLDGLYTRQLDEELVDRAAALAELERLTTGGTERGGGGR